jgi:hypothetical protein
MRKAVSAALACLLAACAQAPLPVLGQMDPFQLTAQTGAIAPCCSTWAASAA